MNSKKQYALVTGATSGIGYGLAKLLAKDGYNLVIVSRDKKMAELKAAEFEKAYKIKVITIVKDLFNHQAPFELYDEIKSQGIKINVLVNNAGQGQYGEFTNTDLKREIEIIQLNIISLVALTKLFLKEMIKRGEGKILNVGSIAGKIPGPYQSVYHGTKAFVNSFTEAIRSEVKDSGVTITVLLLGATETDFFNKADMLNAKNVQDSKLADPAIVAKDGYEALMKDDDKVISGFKNKMQVAMGNILPDDVVADKVRKQQAPKDKATK
ncbi:MAG: SDR family oxidoreductase [Chitinophagaceae bacterium]|nr:SDR family oxidoreductase [Chitinophagaceae bacterium]